MNDKEWYLKYPDVFQIIDKWSEICRTEYYKALREDDSKSRYIWSSRRLDIIGLGEKLYALPRYEFAPVKHGRWDSVDGDCSTLARCSVCGRDVVGGISWDLKGNEYRYSYCPNCGAKMGEVE